MEIFKSTIMRVQGVLIIAVFCLFFGLCKTGQYAIEQNQKAKTLENTVSNFSQKIQYQQIQMNDSIKMYQAEIKTLQFTQDNLNDMYNSLLKASKLKPKDVKSIKEVVSVTYVRDTVIARVDTFGGLTTGIEDNFVKIDVQIFPDRKSIIEYNIRDSLTVISYQKKRSILFGLFKWKENSGIKVVNHNPNAKITGLTSIEVME